MRTKIFFQLSMTVLLLAACGAVNETPQLPDEILISTAVAQIQTEQAPTQPSQGDLPQQPGEAPPPETVSDPGLPGLSPLDVVFQVEGYGFACALPEQVNSWVTWRCDQTTDDYQLTITIWGSTPETMDMIEASAFYYGELADYSDLTAVIFGQIAGLPYEGSSPDLASSWVQQTIPLVQNTGDEALNTFGGVRYHIYALPSSQILEIGGLKK